MKNKLLISLLIIPTISIDAYSSSKINITQLLPSNKFKTRYSGFIRRKYKYQIKKNGEIIKA